MRLWRVDESQENANGGKTARRLRLLPLERCKTQGGSCHRKDAKRKFITTPYVEGDDGEAEAVVPDRCACGENGQSCRIWRHELRNRQDGPDHRLLVIRCVTHERYFTLYPPGWTPFGRRPVADDVADNTLFGPALQAGRGNLWPRHASRKQRGGDVAAMQSRYIERAACWLGLCEEDEQVADAIFEALELPSLSTHRTQRTRWEQASTRRMRGRIVEDVFEELPVDEMCCQRLLRAGMATQVFDAVYVVNHTGVTRRLPLLGSG